LLTAGGDLVKGAVAVWLALALTGNDRVAMLAWLAVVMGHIWPAQMGFRGGKGVSTSLAGLLIYDWRLALIYVLFFLAALALTRRSVAVSLAGYVLLPGASYFWLGGDETQVWGISVLAGLIILAHHRNVVEGVAELWSRRGEGGQSDQSVKES
jgi:glycerol-3-phosphate acyltransferase PlsY